MKKILLSFMICAASTLASFAQITDSQTSTGFIIGCDNTTIAGTNGYTFANIAPSDGGYDNSKVDTLTFGYYTAPNGTMYMTLTLNNSVNLTAPNNVLSLHISAQGSGGADTSFIPTIKLENAAGTVSAEQPMSLTQVYSHQNVTFTALSGQDLTAVNKVTIILKNSSTTANKVGIIHIAGALQAGSLVTAINSSAAALVASTKLYPNPVSDQANIQLDLVTPSDVKVSLSDMMGREVMTIAQGNSMSSVTQSFSVANLQKGIYTVNYFVNGAAAKSELLMVK